MKGDREIRGLSSAEAHRRFRVNGPNHLFKATPISFFAIAKHEITEPMILLLLLVGIFYSVWGRFGDAVTIFTVIVLLVLAEVYNEYRAKKAIAALQKIAAPRAKVLRDGIITGIEAGFVVSGDIIVITPGTDIPADATLEKCISLQVDESVLTGESFPRHKSTGDEVYAGTIVLSGEG